MTSERDDWLMKIRPDIPLIENDKEYNEVVLFQNKVLRPILKLQNGIVLAQFKQYVKKFKPAFNAYNLRVQRNYVDDVLHTDPRIRNSLIATVVSLMTLEEYEFYVRYKNECNKRIVGMLIARIQDHLELLY